MSFRNGGLDLEDCCPSVPINKCNCHFSRTEFRGDHHRIFDRVLFPGLIRNFSTRPHMSRSRNRADNRQNSYSRQERYLCSVLRPNGICNPRPNSLIYEDSNAISLQMRVFVLHIRVFCPPFSLSQITLLHFVTLIKSPHERKNS